MRASELDTSGLKDAEHRVLIRLAHHHNHKTGLCCPGHAEIAAAIGAGERTVRRATEALRDAGIIAWKRNGRLRRIEYTLLFLSDRSDLTGYYPPDRSGLSGHSEEAAESNRSDLTGDSGATGQDCPVTPGSDRSGLSGAYIGKNQEVDDDDFLYTGIDISNGKRDIPENHDHHHQLGAAVDKGSDRSDLTGWYYPLVTAGFHVPPPEEFDRAARSAGWSPLVMAEATHRLIENYRLAGRPVSNVLSLWKRIAESIPAPRDPKSGQKAGGAGELLLWPPMPSSAASATARGVWQRVLDHYQDSGHVSSAHFDAYLARTEGVGDDGEVFWIEAPNLFAAAWLERQMLTDLERTLNMLHFSGAPRRLVFKTKET